MSFFSALQVPILVRHPETRELLVNLDPFVLQAIREADCIRKLGLTVPDTAGLLAHINGKIKTNAARLQVCELGN